jgi:hypothetical protein
VHCHTAEVLPALSSLALQAVWQPCSQSLRFLSEKDYAALLREERWTMRADVADSPVKQIDDDAFFQGAQHCPDNFGRERREFAGGLRPDRTLARSSCLARCLSCGGAALPRRYVSRWGERGASMPSSHQRASVVVVLGSAKFLNARRQIASFALAARLPTVRPDRSASFVCLQRTVSENHFVYVILTCPAEN